MSSYPEIMLTTTPNKRKRESANKNLPVFDGNKENNFAYNGYGCMEIKSVNDLIHPSTSAPSSKHSDNNKFEILRKPPKKKKKHNATDVCCFVNEGLNLNCPENPLNPFEIRRASSIGIPSANGFINSGLNIKGPEKEACNPFEIVRQPIKDIVVPAVSTPNGIENPALEFQPTPRAIGIPFTPTVGCRINFNDVQLESLTPCSMLAKTHLFTPESKQSKDYPSTTPKRLIIPPSHSQTKKITTNGLSMISEETVDIEEELNCYQLELENSINEAKSNEKKSKYKNLMELKHKANFAERIKNSQYNELEMEADKRSATIMKPKFSNFIDRMKNSQYNELDGKDENFERNVNNSKPMIVDLIVNKCTTSLENVKYNELLSDCDDDDEDNNKSSSSEADFKSPAPFVRTYRRSARNNLTKLTVADATKETKENQKTGGNGIRHSIRKSIRKFMSNNQSSANGAAATTTDTAHSQGNTNLFSTLRQSLRKKVNKSKSTESLLYNSNHDVSIMIDTNRKVFRQLSPNKNHMKIIDDAALVSKKKSMIRGSFCKTKRHVMKSVFNKNVEDYCLD